MGLTLHISLTITVKHLGTSSSMSTGKQLHEKGLCSAIDLENLTYLEKKQAIKLKARKKINLIRHKLKQPIKSELI